MYIRSSGVPNKIPLKVCKQAVKFYTNFLLGKRLANNISIKLIFNNKNLDKNIYGFCDWDCDKRNPRNFIISIDPNLSKRMTLMVIAHEIVHVKQYARGELKDLMRLNKVKYLGKLYDEGKINYWVQPWEIEARDYEKLLHREFCKTLKR
jgi:hypothetical protein